MTSDVSDDGTTPDEDLYPWQSISLIRHGYDSLDLVIREESTPLMAFLHVMYGFICDAKNDQHMIKNLLRMKF